MNVLASIHSLVVLWAAVSITFAYFVFILIRDEDRAHRLRSCGLKEYWDKTRLQKAINEMKKEIYEDTDAL